MSQPDAPYPGPDRRRSLVLDAPLQFGAPFTTALIAVIIVNLILFTAFVLYPPMQRMAASPWYPLAVAAIETLLLAVALYFSVLTGKRMIGPVFGVRRVLRSIAVGDLSARVAVRDGEHFEELITQTNQSLDALEERINELRCICAEIDPHDTNPDTLSAQLANLGARLNDIGLSCDEGPRRDGA